MSKFIESKNTDYKDDPFYLEAVNLIGFNKPKIGGSYVKYGKDKACDLDMSENMSYKDFNEYLKKIIINIKTFQNIFWKVFMRHVGLSVSCSGD
jgi:hypothetical protein